MFIKQRKQTNRKNRQAYKQANRKADKQNIIGDIMAEHAKQIDRKKRRENKQERNIFLHRQTTPMTKLYNKRYA